jgi:2-polyprenyl-3-methyl-5-hydroxy-6-metoxy-1,4-benzoquinol methylase
MNNIRLSERVFWDKIHFGKKISCVYPKINSRFLDFELDRTFRKYFTKGKNKVFEIGCGSSVWLPYFAKVYGYEVSGIDYSSKGADNAGNILKYHGLCGNIYRGDAFENKDRRIGNYDIVFSLGFLEHFENTTEVINMMRGYLADKGVVIVWIPNTLGYAITISRYFNKSLRGIYCMLDLLKLKTYFTQAGFNILEARYTQFMDMSFINITALRNNAQKLLSLFFNLINMVFIQIEKIFHVRINTPKLYGGIIVVAEKS